MWAITCSLIKGVLSYACPSCSIANRSASCSYWDSRWSSSIISVMGSMPSRSCQSGGGVVRMKEGSGMCISVAVM